MNMRQMMLMTTAIAIVLTTGFLVSLRGQAGAADPVRVAVVDVQKVFNESDERANVEANIQTRIAQLEQLEQSKREQINQLRRDLNTMDDPQSPTYKKKRTELRQALIGLRVQLEVAQREIEAEKAVQLENIYRKTIEVIGAIAKAEGYDLVLFRDHIPELTNANQQQIASMIQVRKVLYSSDKLDLTERVKQKLNLDFRNQ